MKVARATLTEPTGNLGECRNMIFVFQSHSSRAKLIRQRARKTAPFVSGCLHASVKVRFPLISVQTLIQRWGGLHQTAQRQSAGAQRQQNKRPAGGYKAWNMDPPAKKLPSCVVCWVVARKVFLAERRAIIGMLIFLDIVASSFRPIWTFCFAKKRRNFFLKSVTGYYANDLWLSKPVSSSMNPIWRKCQMVFQRQRV